MTFESVRPMRCTVFEFKFYRDDQIPEKNKASKKAQEESD
jgi:hypothetical protein